MYKQRYHIFLLLLLTVVLPATVAARKKNPQPSETSLLSLDEQQYFDSLYFLAVTQGQCERPDSAVKLMKQAVAFYDSVMTSQGYELSIKLPTEEPKEVKKGIKNDDIEAWLRGRTARTNREISLGQKASLEAQEREMAEANRQNAEQAIFDAQAELVAAEKAVPDEQLRAQDAIVKAKRNKFERLKRDYEKAYKVHLEDVSGSDDKKDGKDKKGPQGAQDEPQAPVVTLTEEEIAVLDEPTLAKYNEPDAKNKDKREIKAKAQEKIREKNEADERRRQQIESVKGDLATIGAKNGMDAAKIVNGFDKSADRNDPVKRAAVARLKNFVGKDKEFKTYKSLDKLMK